MVRSKCVLLVNCFTDEREMYEEYLRFTGFDPIDVCEPSAAFDRAVVFQPDVIVTDIALAGHLDGLEFIRQVRRDARTRHAIIIVVSGHVFANDRAKASAAGCDVFLPKPCLPEALVAAIYVELQARRPRAVAR